MAEIITQVAQLTRTPIEYTDIQLQEVQGRDVEPKVGFRIVRYLDGFQVFPTVYEGKLPVRLYDRPLFQGIEEINFSELRSSLPFNVLPQSEFRQSTVKKIKEGLFSKFSF